MSKNDLDELAENIGILVHEELEAWHWLAGHPQPVAECPVCRAHRSAAAP